MNKRRPALSLLEILIAVGVLAAMLTPVLFSFGAGTRGIQMTQEEFVAHNAALELLEQLCATPFRLIPLGSFTDAQLKDGLPMGPSHPLVFHVSPQAGLQRSLEIKEVKSGQLVRFKKIEVRIALLDRSGKPSGRVVTLKTLVANET
ncbi:MAG: type II secretion system protein [Candidatus Riflebacteria bacterium]|nr:type II secretion system protein [Candidatus Riflebacteria bacterium]